MIRRSDFDHGRTAYCMACESEYQKEWYLQNRDEQLKQRRANYRANKDAYKRRARESVERNPESRRVYIQKYMANRRSVLDERPNDLTTKQWVEILGAFGGKCAYCGSDRNIQMDHFYPVAHGGATTSSNVVPACKRCNHAKFAYDPLVWLEVG